MTDSGRLASFAKSRAARVDSAVGRGSIVFRLGRELGLIEVVGQALELALTRLRDGEEAWDRPRCVQAAEWPCPRAAAIRYVPPGRSARSHGATISRRASMSGVRSSSV